MKLTLKYYYLYVYKTMKLWWKWLWKDREEPRYVLKNDGPSNNTYRKWVDWKNREYIDSRNAVMDKEILEGIAEIHKDVMTEIEYKRDNGDYWNTAEKTMEDGYGDCEDQAILIYSRVLKRYGIRNNCFICLVPGHAFCVVRYKGEYMMYDNGNYTMRPEKMRKVLPYYDTEPMYMFTIDSINYVETE